MRTEKHGEFMKTEEEFVISSFNKSFSHFADTPLVIYGIGKNTKYVLDSIPDFNIIGLMDEARNGESVYNKPVLSFEEVLRYDVKVIIIIARSSNTWIIYRRIAKMAVENAGLCS